MTKKPLVVSFAGIATVLLGAAIGLRAFQSPVVRPVDEKVLREYTGVYQWGLDAFVYLQMWDEFTGFGKPKELVAFDESGEVRTLYPTNRDQFFAGPGMSVPTSVESQIEFQRDVTGTIISLTWGREGAGTRTARRVETERHEDVRFSSGDIQLAGTLVRPASNARHPAIILVHGSGAEDREYMLPWARFLIRRGIAVLGYDKRGVGGSTGDWNTASFEDLAGDVVAAFKYLKTLDDIDSTQIGLLGISQAGWIMPLAAVQEKELAFLISISGAGVPPTETTLDQARNEMTMTGMPGQTVDEIMALLKLQYEFARTGQGWEEYAAARTKLAARRTTTRHHPRHTRPPILAIHQAVVLLRSSPDASATPDPDAGAMGSVGQQRPGRKKQGGVGGGPPGGREPRLHVSNPAECESLAMGGEDRK